MTKEEWIALKADELCKKLFKALRKEENLRKEAWADDMYADKRENDIQIGFIQGLRFVRNGGFMDELIEEEEFMKEEESGYMKEE